MKKYQLIILLLLPLFGFVCVTKKMRKNFIQVENFLPINIYCIPSYNHPDTMLTFTNREHILANDSIYFVSAQHTKKLFYLELCRAETWNKLIKSDSLQVFVFEEHVIKERTWDEIKANNLYFKRLTYAFNDIVNKGCKITIR